MNGAVIQKIKKYTGFTDAAGKKEVILWKTWRESMQTVYDGKKYSTIKQRKGINYQRNISQIKDYPKPNHKSIMRKLPVMNQIISLMNSFGRLGNN